MGRSATQKLIDDHAIKEAGTASDGIALRIDQALLQDATGTLVMLALEAMQLDRAKTEVAVQYVDHNLLQQDYRNREDHIFLESAARRLGLWYSRPGNGVSHPLHQASFGVPGKTLIGSDSHTPAAGAIGMLAFGAGGLDVAMAIAGEPYRIKRPEIRGVRLVGELSDGVSAKDVILEMLRRHGVSGGNGCIIEYFGEGLDSLGPMDRHVIANMGTELGATTSVFPSDEAIRRYLEAQGRRDDWVELIADHDADYDHEEEIDLSTLEPLIAKPSSPGNVVPVREVKGRPVHQTYIGSSANPGYGDFSTVARMVRGQTIDAAASLEINPTSRMLLEALIESGDLGDLLESGARLHQAGCNGCIGMGQAPARGRNSLRTVPRNFPGRSGTPDDSIYLCSPETAAASALSGEITDPRDHSVARHPKDGREPDMNIRPQCEAPVDAERTRQTELVKGDNIGAIPDFAALPEELDIDVLLWVGDDLSTDEILPAGADVLPYRSNISRIARFCFRDVEPGYARQADEVSSDGHAVIAGQNYGQGSSREHAALAPRSLGLRCVIARSFSRIHRQNLINYGVMPLTSDQDEKMEALKSAQQIRFRDLRRAVRAAYMIEAHVGGDDSDGVPLALDLTDRERAILLAGGLINHYRACQADQRNTN